MRRSAAIYEKFLAWGFCVLGFLKLGGYGGCSLGALWAGVGTGKLAGDARLAPRACCVYGDAPGTPLSCLPLLFSYLTPPYPIGTPGRRRKLGRQRLRIRRPSTRPLLPGGLSALFITPVQAGERAAMRLRSARSPVPSARHCSYFRRVSRSLASYSFLAPRPPLRPSRRIAWS
jgi:hypothetical protein